MIARKLSDMGNTSLMWSQRHLLAPNKVTSTVSHQLLQRSVQKRPGRSRELVQWWFSRPNARQCEQLHSLRPRQLHTDYHTPWWLRVSWRSHAALRSPCWVWEPPALRTSSRITVSAPVPVDVHGGLRVAMGREGGHITIETGQALTASSHHDTSE